MNAKDIFGGNPIGVVVRLILLSLVVGIVLTAMGITPRNLFYHLDIIARRIYELGFGAFDWVIGYIVLGAMVVVPIWLVARAFGVLGGAKSRESSEPREGSR